MDLKRHTISLKETRYMEEMRGVENSNGNLSAGMRKKRQPLIGALMWIATNRRPDISAVVGNISAPC
ncbi:hypothetical protein SeLEV6574_g07477 [Synchytrium endobioticum]|uniref:Uncharacterized protein n=1 Tax=Synchytrium endobioticum TaxID=286115 RepID=A0A507CHE6_9FUNG|nr:hypothetical protein SeLEV6574_g07477 [Synchytrium endobioticum]